jgi:hypothetical protein
MRSMSEERIAESVLFQAGECGQRADALIARSCSLVAG